MRTMCCGHAAVGEGACARVSNMGLDVNYGMCLRSTATAHYSRSEGAGYNATWLKALIHLYTKPLNMRFLDVQRVKKTAIR